MDTKELWNLIVKDYNKYYNQPEKVVQELWENYFSEVFGYKKMFKEIDAQRSIKIGSGVRTIPDIIIRKNNEDLFDVELKQYHLQFDNNMELQLKSYMDLLHIAVGILICKKLYIYVYNYEEKELKKLGISFIENNPDGIRFIEIFSKDNFSKEKVNDFIDSENSRVKHIQEIREQVNDPQFILRLIKDYFSEDYEGREIEKALQAVKITVERKEQIKEVNVIKTISGELRKVPEYNYEDDDVFLETVDTPDFIIIKTTPKRIAEVGDIYFATRYCWRVKYETVKKFKYVLSVVNGIVKAVYEVDYWQLVNDGRGRYEFFGHEAPNEISKCFINMKIPSRFRKPGLASPVLYSTMEK